MSNRLMTFAITIADEYKKVGPLNDGDLDEALESLVGYLERQGITLWPNTKRKKIGS